MTQNGKEVEKEIDTRAAASLNSKTVFDQLQSTVNLSPLKTEQVKFHTYTKVEIEVLGSTSVTVQSRANTATVVKRDDPSLIGLDWLAKLQLDWKAAHCQLISLFKTGL